MPCFKFPTAQILIDISTWYNMRLVLRNTRTNLILSYQIVLSDRIVLQIHFNFLIFTPRFTVVKQGMKLSGLTPEVFGEGE